MAKPSEAVDWATDTNYVDGGEDWNATPTKINPAAGRRLEGFEPRNTLAATYLNYLFNALGKWVEWLGDRFDDDGRVDFGALIPYSRVVDAAEMAPTSTAANPSAGWWLVNGGSYFMECDADADRLIIPLTHHVPEASVTFNGFLRQVVIRVNPGAARATAGHRMQFALIRRINDTSDTSLATATDDGTTNAQDITLNPADNDIDQYTSLRYFVVVTSGQTTSPPSGGAHDIVYYARGDYSAPGHGY